MPLRKSTNGFRRFAAKKLRASLFFPAVALAIGLAVAIGGGASKAAVFSAGRPAPKAVTPFTSFEFGEVYTGETISQIFVIRNDGDADLLLTDFRGG